MNKNLKIWFSPKSRKVRCCVQRPVAINLASGDRGSKLTIPSSSKPKDLSVFNFTSSSQDSDSSPHRKKVQTKSKRVHPASKQARGSKSPKTRVKREYAKLKLEAVNQRWEVGKEDGKREEDNVSTGDDNRRSGKKVSFKSMSSQLEEPQNLMSQDDETQILSFDERVLEVDETPASSENSDDDFLKSQGPPKPSYFGALKRTREDQDVDDPQTMPKRLRSSPGDGKRLSKSASQSTSPSSSENPSHDSRSSGQSEEGLNVKSFISPSCRTRSPGTPVLGMRSQGGQSKRGSPAYMKRNHMGETSLHLAATKGDVEEVRKLLALGVDPNLKDNAGWTPLHEACHLGHLGVVEVLLQQGALLNTPGYQNDSPLHDAVRSGQLAVVKLLVKHRASQSLLSEEPFLWRP